MSRIAVTVRNAGEIRTYADRGAREIILAMRNASFCAADSFDVSEIRKLGALAHEAGLIVSVNANRLFHEDEKELFRKQIREVLEDGADYIIYSDPAVLLWAEEWGTIDRLIYDPLTLLTSTNEVRFYTQLGIASAVVSPILTSEEIRDICEGNRGVSVPVFGHQIVSVSRRKLLREYADTLNLPGLEREKGWRIQEESRDYSMFIYENDVMTAVYTDYVLESFSYLKEMAGKNVERFVMNCEWLSEECVSDAIESYQKVLNGEDAAEVREAFVSRYGDIPFMEGYFGWKTVK